MSNTVNLRKSILLFFSLLLLNVGCTTHIQNTVNFPDADSLRGKAIDSMYHVLDDMNPLTLSRASQAEYFYLKMVCADGLLGEIPFIDGLKASTEYYINKGNKDKAAKSLFYLGMGYWHNHDYLSVISALNQSLLYQSEVKPTDLLAFTHYFLSRMYSDQGYNEESLEHCRKACEVGRALPGFKGMHSMYSRTAISFARMNQKDSAMYYYKQALQEALIQKDSAVISDCYNNIAVAQMSNDLYSEALTNLDLSFSYDLRDLCNYYYNKAVCYANVNSLDTAYYFAMKSMFEAHGNVAKMAQFYGLMYQIQRDMGRYQSACAYQDSAVVAKDSLAKVSVHDDVEGLLRKYQKELHKKELEVTQKLSIAGILLVVFLAIAIVLGVAFWNNRKSVMLQRKLDALNIEIRNKSKEIKKSDVSADVVAVRENLATETSDADNQSKGGLEKETMADSGTLSAPREVKSATQSNEDLQTLYLKKLAICAELFKSKPAFETLRKLRFREDHSYLNDVERKPLLDAIVEAFVDVLQGMLQEFPELTNDECLYAILSYLGCNNAMMSAITKTSEETLRKRKSRIKQKVSQKVFEFVFRK